MDGELLSLKWNNHRTTFYHVISGLRNKSGMTPWESENSSAGFAEGLSGAVAAAVAAASQPQQQRQQQQLGCEPAMGLRCRQCGLLARNPYHLRQHLMIHTGERPLKCGLCPYSCIKTNDLKKHMDTHTGQKRYQCPYCPHRSARRNSMRLHVASRHGQAKSYIVGSASQ